MNSLPPRDPATGLLPAERPTRVRFGVLGFLCTLSFVLYIDRICLGQAAIPIQEELRISNTQISYVHMAFTIAYTLFEIPTGRWGDRFGSRGVLTRIVLWWSAFTTMTGEAISFWMLVVTRFLFGAGEAGAYPNTARVLARWIPTRERGMAQGLIVASAACGAMIAPSAAGHLIELVGWRWSFAIFGSLGVGWAAAFYWWFRDDPASHPSINEAELRHIAAGTSGAAAEHDQPVPWRLVFTSANVWLLGLIQICGAFAQYFYYSWLSAFLHQGRGVTQVQAGDLASVVGAGGAVGSIAGGFVAHFIAKHAKNPGRIQRWYGFAVMAVGAVCLGSISQIESPRLVAGTAAFASMVVLSQQATWWSVAGSISGRHLGALFGLMNSLGGIGALSSQYFVGVYTDWRSSHGHTGREQWDPAFIIYGIVLAVGACAWLFLQPGKSAVERTE